MCCQYNTEDRPPPNKFLSIQAIPQSSFRPTFHNNKTGSPVSGPGEGPGPGPSPASAGPGGAFAGFGVNGGVIGSAPGGDGWHAKRTGQSTS